MGRLPRLGQALMVVAALLALGTLPVLSGSGQRPGASDPAGLPQLTAADSARISAIIQLADRNEQLEIEASVRGREAQGVVTTHPGGRPLSTHWVALQGAGYTWGPGGWQQYPMLPGYVAALSIWPRVAASEAAGPGESVERNGRTLQRFSTDASTFFELLYAGVPMDLPIGSGQLDLFADAGVPVEASAHLEMPSVFDPSELRVLDVEYDLSAWGEPVQVGAPSGPPVNAPSYQQPSISAPTDEEQCRRRILMQERDQMDDAQRRALRAVLSASDGAAVILFRDGDHDGACKAQSYGGVTAYDVSLTTRTEPTPQQPILRGWSSYEGSGDGSWNAVTGAVAPSVARVEILLSDGSRIPARIGEGRFLAVWQSASGSTDEAAVAYDAAGREVGRS